MSPGTPIGALLIALVPLLVASCAAGGGRERARSDTGPGPDTGLDTSVPDTSMPLDSGMDADIDAGPLDSGMDSGTDSGFDSGPPDTGPPDTGFDAGCRAAADCSDGLRCNGTERCVGGVCQPGLPFPCDDSIPCTLDTCAEPGTCAFTPDDTRCPGGTCSAAAGCVSSCPETPCRLVSPQCGCPATQGCYVTSGMRICATAGAAPEGARCMAASSCAPGNLCLNISSSPATTSLLCSHFCTTNLDCAPGALCIHNLSDGMGGSLPGVTLCSQGCDPVRQTGCPIGTACDFFTERAGAMRTFADCTAPTGTRTQGMLCTVPSDCAPGYACIDPDGAMFRPRMCLHWCEVFSGTGCTGLDTCFAFIPVVRVNGVEYGVCD